jgi:uncharacterized protein (TIGR03546 family)
MTLLLKQIFAFLRLLNSDSGHNQLAAGLACGIILGFSPFFSLQTFLVLLLVFFLRIQLGAAFLSAFFFKFVAFLVDPLANLAGRAVLENESLRPLFVKLYNMPIVPFTRFNDSIIMGSFIIGALLAIPGFFVFRKLIDQYRVVVLARIRETKVWKAVTATKFYNWYVTYEKLYL